jgi:hypothetical protein
LRKPGAFVHKALKTAFLSSQPISYLGGGGRGVEFWFDGLEDFGILPDLWWSLFFARRFPYQIKDIVLICTGQALHVPAYRQAGLAGYFFIASSLFD